MKVNSVFLDLPSSDLHCLMLQGASIVRFANAHLDAYKKEKTFVFMAIFITSYGAAKRYLLYQEKGSFTARMFRISLSPTLKRRRYIARHGASISKRKKAALDLHLKCTISLLH